MKWLIIIEKHHKLTYMEDKRIIKQIARVEEDNKHRKYKGVAFALRVGNKVDYVHIPTLPQQAFVYFENTSKLSAEERQKKYKKIQTRNTLLSTSPINKKL